MRQMPGWPEVTTCSPVAQGDFVAIPLAYWQSIFLYIANT